MTPQLRFPQFSDEWRVKKLGNLFNIGSSKRVYQSEWQSEGVPFYRTREIVALAKGEEFKSPIFISKELFEQYRKKYGAPVKGDLLLTGVGTIGKIYYITGDFDFYFKDGNVIWLKKNAQDSTLFLYYAYQTRKVRKQVEDNASITTVGTYTIDDARKTKVSFPSKPEQEKIAEFLTAVDERIGKIEKKLELLQQYKKGVMQKIFTQQIRFKNENGEAYPEWEELSLSEVASRVTERNKTNMITNVLTNSAVQGVVSQTDFFDKDIANQGNLLNYHIVSTDDFVYNPRISVHAPVGPINRNHLGAGVMSPLYSVFRFKKGVLAFFENYFKTKYWHEYLKSVANSGARHDRMNITTADFYNMTIPFPSVEEQQKIAAFLAALDDKIKAEQTRLTAAKQWKKGLLQRMFI